MSDHISPEGLDLIAGGDMPSADLARADAHLRECAECRELLQELVPSGASLLAEVRHEARRHLTFEELETCLSPDSEQALNPLAADHLRACATCQRELGDLRAFEAIPSRVRALPAAAEQRAAAGGEAPVPRAWWSHRAAWAGALAAGLVLALVVSRFGLFGGGAAPPVIVHLRPPGDGAQVPDRPRALQPGASDTLTEDVLLEIARAQTAATESRSPQSISVRIARSDYGALLDTLAAVGTFEGNPRGERSSGAGGDTIEVSITLIP